MDLYKISNSYWVVVDLEHTKEPQVHDTIEAAAEYMEHRGISPDEIDFAIVSMATKGDTRAHFGDPRKNVNTGDIVGGSFIFSDRATLHTGHS